MKQEIWRNYPVGDKVDLVERLLERNVLADPRRKIAAVRQPGKCCDGCTAPPSTTTMVALPTSTRSAS
jgi:4-hydroxybutyryl-CoA dehydratase/vinylacetyl-CoA-Delta-isomerase